MALDASGRNGFACYSSQVSAILQLRSCQWLENYLDKISSGPAMRLWGAIIGGMSSRWTNASNCSSLTQIDILSYLSQRK
jgi:hypothetical protein